MAKKIPARQARRVTTPTVPPPPTTIKQTWSEERFVSEYIRNGGNATDAYYYANPGSSSTRESARVIGSRMLARVNETGDLERERERLRATVRFAREDALKILVAMATTTPDELSEVLRSPRDREAYVGLGHKKHAIHVQKTPEGYNASTASLSERRAAINDLWEKLGLGSEGGGRDRLAFFDGILGLVGNAGKKGT